MAAGVTQWRSPRSSRPNRPSPGATPLIGPSQDWEEGGEENGAVIGERPANSAVIGGRPAKRAEVKSRAEDAGDPSCFAAAAASSPGPAPAPVRPRPRSPLYHPRITGSSSSSSSTRPGQAAGRPGDLPWKGGVTRRGGGVKGPLRREVKCRREALRRTGCSS